MNARDRRIARILIELRLPGPFVLMRGDAVLARFKTIADAVDAWSKVDPGTGAVMKRLPGDPPIFPVPDGIPE